MEDDYTSALQDDRWLISDKIKQLKGILELHEKSKRWMKTKEKIIQKSQKKEMKELAVKIKQTREVLKNFRDRDAQEISQILHKDPEIERSCGEKTDIEIEENIKQWIFCKRKELDRVNCEVTRKEDELYSKKLEIELLKQSIGGKHSMSQAELKVQETAAEIERVVLQQEAARILQNSYSKMRRILHKDARKYDTILAGLKDDIMVQCQCVLKALELGQIATEDEGKLKKKYFEKLKKVKETGIKNAQEIRELKKQIEKIKETEYDLKETDVHNRFQNALTSEIEANYNKAKEKNIELKYTITNLKEIFEARTPEELFTRAEDLAKINYRLIRQKSIAEYWKKDSLMRTQHMEAKLESLQHTLLLTLPVYRLEKSRLEAELKGLKEAEERSREEAEHDGGYIVGLRLLLMHLRRALHPIALERELKRDQELEEMVKTSQSCSEDATGLRLLDPFEPERDDDLIHPDKIDLDENHMFDTISLKVMFMVRQLEPFNFLEEVEDEVRHFYAANATSGELEAEGEETPDKSKVSVAAVEEVRLVRCGIQSRKDMKDDSRAICAENEAKPTAPQQLFRIVKHECF